MKTRYFVDSDNLDFSLADNSPCSLGTLEFIGAYNTGDCGEIELDCYGYPGGEAYYDDCDECVGGNTECDENNEPDSEGIYICEPCIGLAIDNYLPNILSISSIFPNPFNPNTVIEYSVPLFSDITINVYDISGRFVKTLIDKTHSAGDYSIFWETDDIPAGAYVVSLVSDRKVINRKITVIK